MQVLVLRIEAPLASFGDVAINETRPTGLHPLKSMIAGLLANALGYKREDPADIQRLQDGLRIASRIDRAPKRTRDYQIAFKSKKKVCPKTGKISFLHKENVWTSKEVETGTGEGSMQIYKHYLSDVSYTVAIHHADEDLLLECSEAIKKPVRPVFLGRKGCFPSRPLFEAMIECDCLMGALQAVPSDEGLCSVRTEPDEGHLLGNSSTQRDVYDLKDWGSNIHMTTRKVAEGMMQFGEDS